MLRTLSEKSRQHPLYVTEILRFALNDSLSSSLILMRDYSRCLLKVVSWKRKAACDENSCRGLPTFAIRFLYIFIIYPYSYTYHHIIYFLAHIIYKKGGRGRHTWQKYCLRTARTVLLHQQPSLFGWRIFHPRSSGAPNTHGGCPSAPS